MDNKFFKSVENKTGVNMNDVFKLAGSLQNANFKDENTVRGVIKKWRSLQTNVYLKKWKTKSFNRLQVEKKSLILIQSLK